MTPEELKAIKARNVAACAPDLAMYSEISVEILTRDIPALVAEVERLTLENARLRADPDRDTLECILADASDMRHEIASLTAMRDNRVKALAIADAEIARLRATSEAQRKTIGELEDVSVQWMNETKRLRAELEAAKADRASARAALAKEREACDEARRLVGLPNPFDPKWSEDMRAWCDRYSARRAAEAKEQPK